MSRLSQAAPAASMHAPAMRGHDGEATGVVRSLTIGLIAFLTVVDLFATQAILPSLTQAYGVTPSAMGFAVNASTMGMAVAGLLVALFSRRIPRRAGILLSLCILAVPTALLATAPNLTAFTLLRVLQGLCMASAFTLTLAYLGEECSSMAARGAVAAYITGNVASNLVGRLVSAGVADHLGLAANFYFFSALNLSGAMLVYFTMRSTMPLPRQQSASRAAFASWFDHMRNPVLRASFAIGFCILFAFIGTFTFVNFVLVGERFLLSRMQLGLVYFVFLPSLLTTPFAGHLADRLGARRAFLLGITVAATGLPLLLTPNLAAVMAGLMLVGIGTFLAQAVATGFVGRVASSDRASASGIYLASYFGGGLVGGAVLGQVFDRAGWTACVLGIAVSLAAAAWLALWMTERRPDCPARSSL